MRGWTRRWRSRARPAGSSAAPASEPCCVTCCVTPPKAGPRSWSCRASPGRASRRCSSGRPTRRPGSAPACCGRRATRARFPSPPWAGWWRRSASSPRWSRPRVPPREEPAPPDATLGGATTSDLPRSLVDALVTRARRRPLAVLLDDVQDLGDASRTVLDDALAGLDDAGTRQSPPLFVLLTARAPLDAGGLADRAPPAARRPGGGPGRVRRT